MFSVTGNGHFQNVPKRSFYNSITPSSALKKLTLDKSINPISMKSLILIFSILWISAQAQPDLPKSIHDFTITTLDGEQLKLSDYKGKKLLLVNTASKCGYTPQYKELEELYQKYGDKLAIIGFPANNFRNQEPGSNEEIAVFCEQNYGVTFPMSEKISVKGKDQAPIYQWLTSKKYNRVEDSEVKWNFQKYLIDENGKLLAVFKSAVNPMSDKIVGYLK